MSDVSQLNCTFDLTKFFAAFRKRVHRGRPVDRAKNFGRGANSSSEVLHVGTDVAERKRTDHNRQDDRQDVGEICRLIYEEPTSHLLNHC